MYISNHSDHNRKRTRLANFDYSAVGMYFVTICTANREHFFGEICDGKMILNDCGKIADKCWREIPTHFPNTKLDEFVVMPNHVHGIVWIENSVNDENIVRVGDKNFCPLQNEINQKSWQSKLSRSLSSIIRGFKIGVTKWCRQNSDIYLVWQRLFHDHIVRDDEELNRVREYISLNPKNWKRDKNNLSLAE